MKSITNRREDKTIQPSTILVVDDNSTNLEVLTTCLKEQGYKTPVAKNGQTALERARRIQPDLVLLDVLLPKMDGFEVCRQLKADPKTRDIPVIFTTSLSDMQDKLVGFEVGGVDYITKPFRHQEVLARVATHLQLRQQAAALARANAEISALNGQLESENIRISTDLLVTEFKYKTLMEEMIDGFCVLQDGRILFANSMFVQMHQYDDAAGLGQPFERLVAHESRWKLKDVFAQSHRERSHSQTFEYLRQTPEGNRPTEMTIRSSRREGFVIDVAICRDITERVEMEKRLRHAERMAYIGKLTTSLSHEIRNPLSAVKLNLQILKKIGDFQEEPQEYLDISLREVMRLEGTLNELLNFAKPLSLKSGACHVNGVLNDCVSLFKAESDTARVDIVCELADGLPTIQADEKKLTQVFINVLLNAIEMSEAGTEIRIRSRVRRQEPKTWIEVTIEDEGPGIPEQQLSDIFEPFFTTKSQGTGLGLTNVKQIVEAHKGIIEVDNRRPHGAIFRICLPIEPTDF